MARTRGYPLVDLHEKNEWILLLVIINNNNNY